MAEYCSTEVLTRVLSWSDFAECAEAMIAVD
jgi:hypothetical protein